MVLGSAFMVRESKGKLADSSQSSSSICFDSIPNFWSRVQYVSMISWRQGGPFRGGIVVKQTVTKGDAVVSATHHNTENAMSKT
eukprot:scaffold152397_cov24-Attheya_sp.AAC.1